MLNLTSDEFESISNLLHAKTGVKLRESKKPLVLSRLRNRLVSLKLESFSQYVDLLKKTNSEEDEFFINALTTNETYFFRHANQFNFLFETALTESLNKGVSDVTIWSAACSTGEEPYSIAITMSEFAKKHQSCKYKIIASDINTQVIDIAKKGTYTERSLKEASSSLKEKYFDVIKEDSGRMTMYQTKSEILKQVEFFQHNLQEPSSKKNVDIIFLRNVLIYFERDIKQKVVGLIERSLKPGGYFFISLSENLNDIETSLKSLRGGVFQKIS